MSILTKEVIQKILNDDWLLMDDCEGLENCTVIKELARMALAAIDNEPFAYIIQDKYERERGVEGHLSRSHVSKYVSQEDINEHEITCTPLYRHAQQPVVLDGFSVDRMEALADRITTRITSLEIHERTGNISSTQQETLDAFRIALEVLDLKQAQTAVPQESK